MHPNDPAALKNGSFVSSREMWNFINELGISKVSGIPKFIAFWMNLRVYYETTSKTHGTAHLSCSSILQVKLSVEDIEMILETLIYDGKVEKSVIACAESTNVSGQMNIYRSVEPLVPVSPVMHTPCGICPVFDSCRPGGAISPQTCIYMKEWLDI